MALVGILNVSHAEKKKKNCDRRIKLDDAVFTVSVNDRMRNFTRRFD